jgi:Flp pilus assembly protein TadD
MRVAIDPARVREQVDALMASELWSETIEVLCAYPDLVPDSYPLRWALGWAHFKLGESGTAVEHLRAAVRLEPERASAHGTLAFALLHDGDPESAEVHFLKSLELGDSSLARQGLAVLYLQQDRLEEAEDVLIAGLELRPDDRLRAAAYADFLEDVGRADEAGMWRAQASRPASSGDDQGGHDSAGEVMP